MAALELSTSTVDLASGISTAEQMFLTVADRSALIKHPSIVYQPGGPRSLTVTVPMQGAAAQALASAGELPSLSSTSFTSTGRPLTAANKAIMNEVSIEVETLGADSGWFTEEAKLAYQAITMKEMAVRDLICAAAVSGSYSVSDSGVPLTWDHVLSAKSTLANNGLDSGELLGIVHPTQWASLESDMAGLLSPAVAPAFANLYGQSNLLGYKGVFGGVAWFVTTAVNASGSDKVGFLAGSAALGYTDQVMFPHPVISSGERYYDGGRVRLIVENVSANQKRRYTFNGMLGAGIIRDAALCKLVTR